MEFHHQPASNIVSETEPVSPVHLAQASPFCLHPREADLPSWGYTVPPPDQRHDRILPSLPTSEYLPRLLSAYVVDALLWEWLPFHTMQTASFEPRNLEAVEILLVLLFLFEFGFLPIKLSQQ